MSAYDPWDENAPANAFERAGSEYQDYRPSYPPESVRAALGAEDARGLRVVDVGAGTGKFSYRAVEAGARVWAVEPAQAMRRQLAVIQKKYPDDLQVVATTAEATDLPSGFADAVVFAQSWHWVEPGAALSEAARILRPGGHVAIVFNQMDVAIPWVHRLTRIMRSGDVHTPSRPPLLSSDWTLPSLHKTDFVTGLDIEGVKALARTRSSYLKSTPANRQKMQTNLQWYLAEHLGYTESDIIEIPYYTLVWKTLPKRGVSDI